jgi:broad specificity phosphatase PhoE
MSQDDQRITNPGLLGLKPYLESLKEQCDRLSKQELTEVLLGLAKEARPRQRAAFLEKIDRLSRSNPQARWDEGILAEIEALKAEIGERIASIRDGTYHDREFEEHGFPEYDDETPEELSEEQQERLEGFFEDASQLFLSGDMKRARKVYASLLGLMAEPTEGERSAGCLSCYPLQTDLREARARHARCVYETTPLPRRAPALLAVMKPEARLSEQEFDIYDNLYPMLADVMDSRPGELPDKDAFLARWLQALSGNRSDRARMLLLEAALLLEGPPGVYAQVRRWGEAQPRAWLFWMRFLTRKEDWPAVGAAASEALPKIAGCGLRSRIAEQLAEAGRRAGRPDWILAGQRELFFSGPNDDRLLRLIEEASDQGARDEELKKALDFVVAAPRGLEGLRVKLLLMAGRLDEAFQAAARTAAIGWSYSESAGAVLFGSVLAFACRRQLDAAVTVKRVLARHADAERRARFFDEESDGYGGRRSSPEPASSVAAEILRGLENASVTTQQEEQFLQWAIRIGSKRIEQIVSSQHRSAYQRAAEVLGALAECFLLRGDMAKARDTMQEYRNQKFSRHKAFRQKLDQVIGSSQILSRGLRSVVG